MRGDLPTQLCRWYRETEPVPESVPHLPSLWPLLPCALLSFPWIETVSQGVMFFGLTKQASVLIPQSKTFTGILGSSTDDSVSLKHLLKTFCKSCIVLGLCQQ